MHAHPHLTYSYTGFSLIESLVALSLLSLATVLGLPSLNSALNNYRATTALAQLSASVAQARNSAIGHVGFVILCPGSSSTGCRTDSDWSRGWIVFRSRTEANFPALPADLLAEGQLELPSQLRLITNAGRPQLRFTHLGRSDGSNLTFTLCNARVAAGQLIVNNAGRSRSLQPGNSAACQR